MEETDIGKTIKNKYKIIDKINEGSYGSVYLVEETTTKKKFAIKKSKKESYNTFETEKKVLKKLSEYKQEKKISKEDSYTIDMIENFDEKVNTPKETEIISYIVLEYKQKYNLNDYFKIKKTIKERCAKLIFFKILKGVQEIHNAGFCHLDLKLKNILLDEKYKPIICDFGFSMEYSSQLNEYRGTRGFMDPVIFNLKPYDGFKADIFSLGAILLNIVANKEVFYDKNKFGFDKNYKDRFYEKIKDNDIKGYWELLNVENLNLTEKFKTLYIRMISDNPDKRPSIEEIINDPWMIEVTNENLTDEEKNKLEEEVFKEFEVRKEILDYNNKYFAENKNNLYNKKEEVPKNKSEQKVVKSFFNEYSKINYINEDSNLNMKYYFKIIGVIKPHIFMDHLLDNLGKLKKIYNNNNYELFINAYKNAYKIDIKLQYDNEEIKEELINDKFGNIEEYINAFHLQDITIRIKLFKTNRGYLIKVFKKEGDFEIYDDLIKDIMKIIKELF